MLTQTEIDALVRRIVTRTRPQQVIIFGSYAKGVATSRSDLDLLLVKDTPLPMSRRVVDLMPLLAQGLTRVDVHIYTPEEVEEYGRDPFSFIHSVLTTGIVAYPREPQI